MISKLGLNFGSLTSVIDVFPGIVQYRVLVGWSCQSISRFGLKLGSLISAIDDLPGSVHYAVLVSWPSR